MRASTSASQACGSMSFILADYAARRTMPNGSGMARRCHAGIVDRVHGSPIPFVTGMSLHVGSSQPARG
jgi:hypothetical protein